MKLEDYMTVRYDASTMRSYLSVDIPRYMSRHIESDLQETIEQNEIRTGIQLLFKLMKLVSTNPLLHLEIEDRHITYTEYRYFCEKHFNIKAFAREDTECFWFVLSRYYPFTDDEIQEYMQYLNYKELQKNSFVVVPEDVMDSIKLLGELK